MLYVSPCFWLFQEQEGDPCCLQHLAGMVLCLSVALPGGSAEIAVEITVAQEQQKTCRVLLGC